MPVPHIEDIYHLDAAQRFIFYVLQRNITASLQLLPLPIYLRASPLHIFDVPRVCFSVVYVTRRPVWATKYSTTRANLVQGYCHQSPGGLVSVPRWSKFRPKSTKGPGKKKVGRKNLPEFWPNFTKSGRKGAGEYFLKKFLIKWY